jgi:hypothetical protein
MKVLVIITVTLVSFFVYASVTVLRVADAREAARAAVCPSGTVYSAHLTMCVAGSRPWLNQGEKQ